MDEVLSMETQTSTQRHPLAAAISGTFALCLLFLLAVIMPASTHATDVLTYHNDNGRTGQNLDEEILSSTNVNDNHFGKLWVLSADGLVDAQPLYAAGVSIPSKGMHNVLVVATEHGSVYAYDADSTNLFWKVSLLGANETASDDRGCGQVTPEIGITSTPVIDRQLGSDGTIFVVAMSKNGSGDYFQRLHALDLATGTNRLPAVTVSAKYPGTGANNVGTNVLFDPAQYKERCGLLLLGGVVYTAWASHCDDQPYTGWIIGYDEFTLAQTNVLNVTPNGGEGAIWMSGAGLAADTSSNIYFLDANGTFDTTLTTNGYPSNGDYGNAFIKLSTLNKHLAVADYFDMDNTVNESDNDVDLGSGGALVLPDLTDGQGNSRQLAVGAGKDGNLYLVDRTNMGKFNSANNNAIYQELSGALPGGIWSMPAYFNGTLYYGSVGNNLQAFSFQKARLTGRSSQTAVKFAFPGTTPSVSAYGNSNGIVWATENTDPDILLAYAASNLANQYYSSTQAPGGRDNFGVGNKYITPTIASARVYVGTTSGVGVFGLLDESTLTPLEIWRNTNFDNPSNVGAGANQASPSGDGIPNLIKYALGLNPMSFSGATNLPTGNIQSYSGTNYLTLTVNRSADPADITYIVEVSSNLLTGWVSGTPNTVTLINTAAQLVVRDTVPVPSATARFIRLRITNP